MPKSKRDKKVSLTKTRKKGLELKQKVIEDVQNCVEKYESVYLFRYNDIRSNHLKYIRRAWVGSRLYIGRNKLVTVALGRTKEEEVADDIHKITYCLKGSCAFLFTNSTKDKVVEWFENYCVEDVARSGFKVDVTVKLNEGPLAEFQHSMEPYLRRLGLPTKLERGVVTLIKDYVVCKKGDVLKPEQAKILELLGYNLATFRLILLASWAKPGQFEKYEEKKIKEEDDEEMMEDEDN